MYKNIELRAKGQFQRGLIDEVNWLLKNGFDERFAPMQGFGYKEVIRYLRGLYSIDEALAYYIRATKAFYRRQMTWFKKFKPVMWYDLDETNKEIAINDIVEKILKHMGAE